MRLNVTITLLASLLLGLGGVTALHKSPPHHGGGCIYNPANQTVICTGGTGGGASGSVGGTSGSSGSSANVQPPQVYLEIGSLEAATATHPICWVTIEDNVTGDTPATISQIKQFWSVVETVFPPCPQGVGQSHG